MTFIRGKALETTQGFEARSTYPSACYAFLVQVVCHDATSASATECGQDFSVHGIHMPIPDGTPCWHPSEPNVQRIRLFFWVVVVVGR